MPNLEELREEIKKDFDKWYRVQKEINPYIIRDYFIENVLNILSSLTKNMNQEHKLEEEWVKQLNHILWDNLDLKDESRPMKTNLQIDLQELIRLTLAQQKEEIIKMVEELPEASLRFPNALQEGFISKEQLLAELKVI